LYKVESKRLQYMKSRWLVLHFYYREGAG
jgi:hypothetical protein